MSPRYVRWLSGLPNLSRPVGLLGACLQQPFAALRLVSTLNFQVGRENTYRSHFEPLDPNCLEHLALAEAQLAHAVPHRVV